MKIFFFLQNSCHCGFKPIIAGPWLESAMIVSGIVYRPVSSKLSLICVKVALVALHCTDALPLSIIVRTTVSFKFITWSSFSLVGCEEKTVLDTEISCYDNVMC